MAFSKVQIIHTLECANIVAMETFLMKPRGRLMCFFTNSFSFGSFGMGDVGERITGGFLPPEIGDRLVFQLVTLSRVNWLGNNLYYS